MLHEQVAVQMLDLMAEGPGRQPLGLRLEPVAVPVLRPDPYPVGPGDDAPLAGDAEAALQPGLFAALGDDFRVDELQIFFRFLLLDDMASASVSAISSSRSCSRRSNFVTGRQTFVRHSSPCSTIFRNAMNGTSLI